MSVYILTSTETILEVSARPQESHVGDPEAKGILKLQLKESLTSNAFEEQQKYLSTAATAAYVSLNKLDQRQRYRASINLLPINSKSFNFLEGSSSSGLGYALAMFKAWWESVLHKTETFNYPVFATGEILPSGQVNAIGHLAEKIAALCTYVENNRSSIDRFYICYPESNDGEISANERKRIQDLGGIICPVGRLQNVLGSLLRDTYNGDPLGRWQPFKGLSSFNYEDSVRFFGRDKDIERLYYDLQQNNGLLIVSGPSGAGKSSLIKAGLIPKLESYNKNLRWASTTPSDLINSSVLDFILEQLIIAWSLTPEETILDDLKKAFEVSIDSGVSLLTANLTSKPTRCLLYFDQYEEVFSQSSETVESITLNLRLIDELAKKLENLDIVLALRNEYLGRLLDNQVFRSPIISNVTSQLSSQSWYDIVHEQAAFSGISFEENDEGQSLDNIIIEEALKIPFALPMVEFLLEQLHLYSEKKEDSQKVLAISDYQTLGGLSGAIAYRASEVFSKSNCLEKSNKLFSIFVGLNSEYLPFGKQVNLSEIKEEDHNLYMLIQDLINANIIVSYQNSKQQAVAQLAHDSLFQYWDALKEWIAIHTDYLNWRYSIDGQYAQWTKKRSQKSSESYLITDKRLLKEGRQYQSLGTINERSIDEYVGLSLKHLRKRKIAFVSVILLPILIISLLLFDDLRIKTYYYSNIGERWNIPYGINELSINEVKHRESSYRFDYQGGVLIKLTHQNGFGIPTPDDSKQNEALWEYKYTDEDKLLSLVAKNNVGSVVNIINYELKGNTAIASFSYRFGQLNLNRFSKSMRMMPYVKNIPEESLTTKSDISRHYIDYDNSGLVKRRLFQNPYGVNVMNELGAFGIGYTYYENGRVASMYSINSLGEKYTDNKSPVKKYIYDENGFLEKQEVQTPITKVSYKYLYDELGNVIKIESNSKNKTIIKTKDIDERGNVIKITSYNEDGDLVAQKYGVAVVENQYDNKGRGIVKEYFGVNLEPTLNLNTHSKKVVNFDYRGNIVSQSYYGVDGEIVTDVTGCEALVMDFNVDNNPIEKSCKKLDGSLMLHYFGAAKYVYIYDKVGNISQISMFDVEGLPTINFQGFHSKLLKYDDNGNMINESYYDINGARTAIKTIENSLIKNTSIGILSDLYSGVASKYFKYDFKGNVIEETYKDERGNPIAVLGAYKTTMKYDKLGRQIEMAYFDLNDNPVMLDQKFYSKQITEYDKKENIILSENYYDDKGNLISLYDDNVGTKKINKETPTDLLTLNITSNPIESQVFIDEVYAGNTPLITKLEFGDYRIKVAKSGYLSEDFLIYSKDITDISKNINLKKEPELIFENILKKAKSGDSEAQKELGNYYLDGNVVEKDVNKAIEWYKKSALQSNPKAMYNLGYLYSQGIGVKKDNKTEFFWKKKSADLGFSWAQNWIGKSYYHGWFGDKDIEMAYKYLLKSAQQADADSAYLIAMMYENGDGVEKNIVKATHWYNLSAQLGDEDAYYFIGYAYAEGEGIEKDLQKGMKWLMKSSNSNSSEFSKYSSSYLAAIYSNGLGVPINYAKAIEYHKKAIAAGGTDSGYFLGLLILQGRGTPVDIGEAIKYLKTSVDHESFGPEARKWLKKLGYYD